MKAFGIEFTHRRPRDLRDFVSEDFSCFMQFAALVDSGRCARYVKSVFYDTSIQTFVIDVDEKFQHNDIGGWIEFCADKTLGQYELFGIINHKGGLEDAA